MKGNRKYILILVSTLLLFVVFEIFKPRPIDWQITLDPSDKIPYGTFIMNEILPDLFSSGHLTRSEESLYQITQETPGSNLFLLSRDFQPNRQTTDLMLEEIHNGAQYLLAARIIAPHLADTLGMTMRNDFLPFLNRGEYVDSVSVIFKDRQYEFPAQLLSSYVIPSDSAEYKVLLKDSRGYALLLEKQIGEGKLFFCPAPLLLSNIALLNGDNPDIAEYILTRLPDNPVIMASQYLSGRSEPQTPLRFVFSQPALKWAYLVTLFSILLFMVFGLKREQRMIPVETPPENSTLNFAETVGQLYLKHADYRNVAMKRINYLRNNLLDKYQFKASFTPEEIGRVVKQTGRKKATVVALYQTIHSIMNRDTVDKLTLIRINKQLDDFYLNT